MIFIYEGFEIIYTYNNRKDLIYVISNSKIDKNERRLEYFYDKRHKCIEIKSNDKTIVRYSYTNVGKLKFIQQGKWITEYEYDKSGNISSTSKYKTIKEWELFDNLNNQHFLEPGKSTQTFEYDKTSYNTEYRKVISPEGNNTTLGYDTWNRVLYS